ncbi:MAG: LamG-like jellyroll fold domain-containing protein [Bacteroidota bacterium]
MKKLYLSLFLSVCISISLRAQIPWSSKIALGINTAEVAVADVDQDGNQDILVAGGTQRWYRGPDFQDSYILGTSDGGPYAARSADMNGDGWPDFVTSDGTRNSQNTPGYLYVYLNPGPSGTVTGNWQRITVYAGNVFHQNDIRIADMDNDGRLDIIERTWSSERVVVALQNADINNWTVRVFDTGESGRPEGISAGDLDGDGEQEIILSGVYWDNPGGWRSGNPSEYSIDPQFVQEETKSAVGDIDNDGDMDVYMGSPEGAFVYLAWYENTGLNPDGSVSFSKHIIKDNFGKCHMVELIDIDKDGDLDLCTGQSFGETGCLIFYNENNGASWTEQDFDPGGGFYTGIIKDLDGDGDLDAIGPKGFYSQVFYYLNQSPQDPPQAPANFDLALVDGLSIIMNWEDLADNEASYELERKSGTSWQSLVILPANTQLYQDDSTLPNQGYQYRIRAVNVSGNSAWVLSDTINTWKKAGPVEIDPASGAYVAPPLVSLSALTPYEEIRYTLDGTEPNEFSLLYTNPFPINNSLTLKAVALGNRLIPSEQAEADYQVAINGNFPPTADAGEDKTYFDLSQIELDGSKSSDLDDPYASLLFSWRQIAGPLANLNSANSDRASFLPPQSGEYYFELRVSDESAQDLDTVKVSVSELGDFIAAYWALDESTGQTASESVQNLDGSLSNGVSWLPAGGILDGCADFDGESGRIDIPSLDLEGESMSISCWINLADLSQLEGRILSKAKSIQGDDHYWMLSQNGGSAMRFRLKTDQGGTATLISPTGELAAESWYFVTAVYDGSEMRLYKDAVKIASLAKTGSISQDSTVGVAIGNQPSGAGERPFKGLIDDVRIYSKALTEQEIEELYQAGSIRFPVELSFFNAESLGSRVKLSWETAREQNSAYFSIERSPDASGLYQEIARLPAVGNSEEPFSYQYWDEAVPKGSQFYRLRQVDLDQQFSYSQVREVYIEEESLLEIYPNPVQELLNVYADLEAGSKYQVLDVKGRLQIEIPYQRGFQLIHVSLLPPGSYFLQLKNAEGDSLGASRFLKVAQ